MRTRCAASRGRSTGRQNGRDPVAGAPGWELTTLLDRIAFVDYVLNDAVRGQIRKILDRFSDDEFERFCETYGRSLEKDDGRQALRHEARVMDP